MIAHNPDAVRTVSNGISQTHLVGSVGVDNVIGVGHVIRQVLVNIQGVSDQLQLRGVFQIVGENLIQADSIIVHILVYQIDAGQLTISIRGLNVIPSGPVEFAHVSLEFLGKGLSRFNFGEHAVHIDAFQGHNIITGSDIACIASGKDIASASKVTIALDVDIIGNIVAVCIIIEHFNGLVVELGQISSTSVSSIGVAGLHQELGSVVHMGDGRTVVQDSAAIDLQSNVVLIADIQCVVGIGLHALQVHGAVAVGVHAVHGVAFIQAIQTGVRGNMSIFPCKCASSSGVIHIGNRIICIPAAEVAVALSTIDGVHSDGSLGAIHVD